MLLIQVRSLQLNELRALNVASSPERYQKQLSFIQLSDIVATESRDVLGQFIPMCTDVSDLMQRGQVADGLGDISLV